MTTDQKNDLNIVRKKSFLPSPNVDLWRHFGPKNHTYFYDFHLKWSISTQFTPINDILTLFWDLYKSVTVLKILTHFHLKGPILAKLTSKWRPYYVKINYLENMQLVALALRDICHIFFMLLPTPQPMIWAIISQSEIPEFCTIFDHVDHFSIKRTPNLDWSHQASDSVYKNENVLIILCFFVLFSCCFSKWGGESKLLTPDVSSKCPL